jgi:hypothetical protein
MSKAIAYFIASTVLAHSVWGAQAPFSLADPHTTLVSPKKVLTPELRSRIQEILDANKVPGYSLGVLRLDADDQEEYMTWGRQNESDGRVEEEVRVCAYARLIQKISITHSLSLSFI